MIYSMYILIMFSFIIMISILFKKNTIVSIVIIAVKLILAFRLGSHRSMERLTAGVRCVPVRHFMSEFTQDFLAEFGPEMDQKTHRTVHFVPEPLWRCVNWLHRAG